MAEAYIVAAARTAGGKRGGALRDWHPADMAAEILDALVERSGVDPAAVEDVIMGCVGQAGEQAFHIGRNAVLASSLPTSVPAVTIDRQCGSSQQAIQFAAQAVMSGTQDVVIASGVESMTRVPMGLPVTLAMEKGIGTGPFSKRIQDRFGVPMFSQFIGAEMIAEKYQFRREELDQFALESHRHRLVRTAKIDERPCRFHERPRLLQIYGAANRNRPVGAVDARPAQNPVPPLLCRWKLPAG